MALAWGPTAARVLGSRGYKERHVYRVAGCPGYQAMRSLAWQPRPVAKRAICAELGARGGEEGRFRFNGASVDAVATAALADPELDVPPAEAEAPARGDGADGAAEAGAGAGAPAPAAAAPHGGAPPAAQGTLAVHAGEKDGRPRVADSLTTPIVQTSTYTFRDTAELIAYQEGRYGSYEYGRYGNPTTRTCEEKIRVLEGAEDCLVRPAVGPLPPGLPPAAGEPADARRAPSARRRARGVRRCRATAGGVDVRVDATAAQVSS